MNARFSDYLLPDPLMRGLAKAGYAEPTQVQTQVIPLAMDGADLLVSAATGSGKTASFLLPIMQRCLAVAKPRGGARALILAPTRELARQIQAHFLALGSYTRLSAGVITGGESRGHQIATLRRNPELLIATPGRLLEHLESKQAALDELEMLILDEADRMLDMGFADDVLSIIDHSPSTRQSMLFSATLHHRGLSRITDSLLRAPEVLVIDPVRAQHPDIHHQVVLSDGVELKQQQLAWLLEHEAFEKAMVFTNTRDGADALGQALLGRGQRVAVLHGDLEQRERNRIMGLLHSGRVNVLIATDLAARGLDIPGMQLVINFDVPRSGDDYVHRTGRTGRAGETGAAVSLVGPPEWNRMESIARYLNLSPEARTIDGLKASFRGPAKSKPGKGRKKPDAQAGKKEARPKTKDRLRDRKNIGKRRQPSRGQHGVDAGHAPLKRREPSKPDDGGQSSH